MKKILRLIFFVAFLSSGYAQIIPDTAEDREQAIQDSLINLSKREVANDSLDVYNPVISDYTFWREKDKNISVVDTTMTIEKYYKQNFTQKDIFGNLSFPNFGQAFNPLIYNNSSFRNQLLPQGKSFNYLSAEEVHYYNVKTPMTEFLYESGQQEGQYLSTTFAHNLNKNWNYSVRFRGLRSVGNYQRNLAVNNAFIATINHKSNDERLKIWTHYASQRIDDEEGGGIKNIIDFTDDEEQGTTNRRNIAMNLSSARSEFGSKRFHFGGSYALFGGIKTDSADIEENKKLRAPLLLKNVFSYEKQSYLYKENQTEDYYISSVFPDIERGNEKFLKSIKNTSTVGFQVKDRLLIEGGVRFENLSLYSENELIHGLVNIPGKLEDNLFGVVGNVYFDWNERIKVNGDVEFKSGDIFKNQYHVRGEVELQPLSGYRLLAGGVLESQFPSLNLYYNQSFYKDFNYYNYGFKNTETQKLYGKLELDKFNLGVEANLYNIENFVYIAPDFRPKQLRSGVSLFQIKAENLLNYREFHLRTTLEYQKVTQNKDFLPLPDFIGRATLYWQNWMFNNKAEVQIGLNANYFTEFESREFFPVLNEFMLPRNHSKFGKQKIGGYPLLDFFLNIKVQRMQIFLRADHFNSLWGENNYFSAPFVPYRDFKIQIGVKWYLFT